jgi:hypothetical protein
MSLSFIKYFLAFFLVLGIVSCPGNFRKERMVREYERQHNPLANGMNIRVASIDKIGSLTANDSISIFLRQFENASGESQTLNIGEVLQTCKTTAGNYAELEKDLEQKVLEFQEKVNRIDETVQDKEQILANLKLVNEYETFIKSLQLCRNLKYKYEKLYNQLNNYNLDNDKVLAKKYTCTVILAQKNDSTLSEQKTYIFNLSGTQILGILEE